MRIKFLAMLATVAVAFALAVPSAHADSVEFTGLGGSWGLSGTTLTIQTSPLSVVSANGTVLSTLTPVSGTFGIQVVSGPGANAGGSLDIPQSNYSFGVGQCTSDCLTGTFTTSSWPNLSTGGNFTVNFISGSINTQLLTDLAGLGYFGGKVPSSDVTGFFGITLDGANAKIPCPAVDASFSSCGSVGSLDLSVTPVPEPGTLTLLGTGLLGLAGFFRRKLRA